MATDSVIGNLRSLYFTSPAHGYLVTCDPVQSSWSSNGIYSTSDSGKTWVGGLGSEMCSPVVYFYNDFIWYFLTRGSARDAEAMHKTIDGGKTWTRLEDTLSNFDRKGIFFLDEMTGYYGGGDGFFIYKTIDGGATWASQHTGSMSSIIDAMYFMDKDTGIIAGWYGPKIARTTNGGTTWNDVTNKYGVYGMHFPSHRVGYAVASDQSNVPVIIKTTDFGNTWIQVYSTPSNNPKFFSAIHCTNPETCYAVGDSGFIVKTTDGGVLWSQETSGTTQNLNSIFCIGNSCFAAGDDAVLLRTTVEGHAEVTSRKRVHAPIIRPNPAQHRLFFDSIPMGTTSIDIFNVNARPLLSLRNPQSNLEVDIADWSAGLYVIRLMVEGKQLVTTVSVQ